MHKIKKKILTENVFDYVSTFSKLLFVTHKKNVKRKPKYIFYIKNQCTAK